MFRFLSVTLLVVTALAAAVPAHAQMRSQGQNDPSKEPLLPMPDPADVGGPNPDQYAAPVERSNEPNLQGGATNPATLGGDIKFR